MANLNTFRNVSANLTTSNATVYTAPSGYTSIVLMAQVTNITTSAANVTVGWNNGTTNTELVFNLSTPQNYALNSLILKTIMQ